MPEPMHNAENASNAHLDSFTPPTQTRIQSTRIRKCEKNYHAYLSATIKFPATRHTVYWSRTNVRWRVARLPTFSNSRAGNNGSPNRIATDCRWPAVSFPEDQLIEALLLAVTRITTIAGGKVKSNATGFFFERDDRLYLVTARHVLCDEASGHRPDELLIDLHVDPENAVELARL